MKKREDNALLPLGKEQDVRDCIFTIRDVQVMLDRDLAAIYMSRPAPSIKR